MEPFDDAEQARDEILEHHDLQGDAEKAYELLEEVVSLWDDLEHNGRVARLRQAKQTLNRTLEWNSWRIDREAEADNYCPDCGHTEFEREKIGHGQARVFCPKCDHTLQVGGSDD